MLILSNKYLITILPFLSFGVIAFQFFFLQLILKNKFKNFMIATLSLIAINLIYLFINFDSITILDLSLIILTSIMNIYIFLNIIQLPVSSIQINILRILDKKSMSQKKLLTQYNDSKIFDIRLMRLSKSNIIKYKKNKFIIKSSFIIFILNFFLFLRKITKNN